MYKRTITLLTVMLITVSAVLGQTREQMEKIQQMKIAFITERLDMNTEQAQAFWPIYNDYSKRHDQIRKAQMNKMREVRRTKTWEDLSDAEANELLGRFLDGNIDIARNQQDLYKKLDGILTPVQKLRLYQSETEFTKQLVKRLRNEGRENRPGGQRRMNR